MKTIVINSPTYGRKEVLVDDEDYPEISKYTWHLSKAPETFYAIRGYKKQNGKWSVCSMHRQILGLSDSPLEGDHIDHNGLNNQRSNIRVSTEKQNCCNRKSRKGSTSQYLGVSWHKGKRKNIRKDGSVRVSNYSSWTVYIKINGKHTFVGNYKDEREAAKAYDAAARIHHGEFANLNFKE